MPTTKKQSSQTKSGRTTGVAFFFSARKKNKFGAKGRYGMIIAAGLAEDSTSPGSYP